VFKTTVLTIRGGRITLWTKENGKALKVLRAFPVSAETGSDHPT
jgi:hypothetical protein